MLCCHTNTCECQQCDTPTSEATITLSMRLQSAGSDQIEISLYGILLIGVVCGAVVATAQDRDTSLAGRGQPLQAGSWHSSACWRGQERSHSCRVILSPSASCTNPLHSAQYRSLCCTDDSWRIEDRVIFFFWFYGCSYCAGQSEARLCVAGKMASVEDDSPTPAVSPPLLSSPSTFQLACSSRHLRCA